MSWDLIGYLIGFVWIWAVFVGLDGEWSGLWVWRGGGGCGEWVEGVVGGGIGGLEEKEPDKTADERESVDSAMLWSCF